VQIDDAKRCYFSLAHIQVLFLFLTLSARSQLSLKFICLTKLNYHEKINIYEYSLAKCGVDLCTIHNCKLMHMDDVNEWGENRPLLHQ